MTSSIITVHTTAQPPDQAVERAWHVSRFPPLGRYGWSWGFRHVLADCLHDASFAVLHGLYHYPSIAAAAICRRLGIPFVLVAHGGLDPWVFTYRRWRKFVWLNRHRQALFGPHATVVFTTELERKKAQPWLCGATQYVLHWPTSVVPDWDRELAQDRLRTSLGIPPQQRVLLFCGRIHPVKRIVETVGAFLAVSPADWTLLVVGPLHPGIDHREFLALLARANRRVLYAGAIFGDALAEVYKAANGLVLASHKENFGHVVAEAAAHGVPVLVSDGVDLWPEIERAQAGLVVHDCSEERFRRSLAHFLRLPTGSLAQLGANGRAWARVALSPESFEDGIHALVASLHGHRGSASGAGRRNCSTHLNWTAGQACHPSGKY